VKLTDLPLPAALLFDLDGTLLDTRGDIAAACNHVLVEAGRATLPAETIATFVGDGARALLARAFGIARDAPELDARLEAWRAYYVAHPIDHTTWMPGAKEAIAAARAKGIPAALVTNKARVVTEKIFEALGVRFDAMYAGGDGALKPSAEPITKTATTLGVDARDVWMIGDADQDVGAAHAAGCASIIVLGGFHPESRVRAANPDVVITSLHEIAAALRSRAPDP
jgi:phosphoglycolate phosphatase